MFGFSHVLFQKKTVQKGCYNKRFFISTFWVTFNFTANENNLTCQESTVKRLQTD